MKFCIILKYNDFTQNILSIFIELLKFLQLFFIQHLYNS